jgi:acetylornithine/N-succinyldiaminopimelate aminotransferase
MTLAKALGNGFPIGALLATDEVAQAFQPGTHAATFGGNHLAAAVAQTVLSVLLEDGFLARVGQIGEYFKAGLNQLKEKFPQIIEVRGLGLLLGLALDRPGKPIVDACLNRGFLINCTQDTILRFTPPLIIDKSSIQALLQTLKELLKS